MTYSTLISASWLRALLRIQMMLLGVSYSILFVERPLILVGLEMPLILDMEGGNRTGVAPRPGGELGMAEAAGPRYVGCTTPFPPHHVQQNEGSKRPFCRSCSPRWLIYHSSLPELSFYLSPPTTAIIIIDVRHFASRRAATRTRFPRHYVDILPTRR